ncbi:hypothetical protein [Mucilaginibacter segetis]|uniref:Uncharacterized protein n=1 Tax=Mucilaginibacter segetis TaxID=2793071 RepID=A0A934UM40_9SPHI|nr:hypothetical protein [Mucilaginibacter segetis]MBK0379014.1 hypothetical protein [Mucilaginibacter segetis]
MKDKQTVDDVNLLQIKANELVVLLKKGEADAKLVRAIKQQVVEACDEASLPKKLEAFNELNIEQDRLDLLNGFEFLLTHHQLDSNESKKYLHHEHIKKSVIVIISIIMITLGMAMIIMPAPPYFEMFTVFYFNKNDGVTIMDIISLLIVFTGVYLFLNAILKKKST